jgi:hypothetical protein
MTGPKEMIMSTILRSALVALALIGSVSAASAHSHSYGHGYWSKSSYGAWKKHNTRAFFDQMRRNGS